MSGRNIAIPIESWSELYSPLDSGEYTSTQRSHADRDDRTDFTARPSANQSRNIEDALELPDSFSGDIDDIISLRNLGAFALVDDGFDKLSASKVLALPSTGDQRLGTYIHEANWLVMNDHLKMDQHSIREKLFKAHGATARFIRNRTSGRLPGLYLDSPFVTRDGVSLQEAILRFIANDMRIVLTDEKVRIAHKDTMMGDRICFIPNCPLLVVLRPVGTSNGKTRRFVCELYDDELAQ